jgi:hypothetical protein
MANYALAATRQGDYRRAIDCFRQTVASLDGGRHRERFGQIFLPAVTSRAFLSWCMPSWAHSQGGASEKKGPNCRNICAPASRCRMGLGLLASRQGDHPGHSSARTVHGHLSGRGLDRFPWIAPTLGAAYTLEGASPCHAAAHAVEQTTAME